MRSQIFSWILVAAFSIGGAYVTPIVIEYYSHEKTVITPKSDHKEYGGGRGTIIGIPPPK